MLIRIHRLEHEPIWFGRTGGNRFDDPLQAYGVLYAGASIEGAFAEVFMREPGRTLLPKSDFDKRRVTTLETTRHLRLVMMTGAGLARLGATAAVSSGPHKEAQTWSAAIHAHPAVVDGIIYRARHDDDEYSVALFDRCRDGLRVFEDPIPLPAILGFGDVLGRYGIGLDASS